MKPPFPVRALESNEQLLRTAVVEQGTETSGNLVTDGRSPQAQWIIEESRFFEKSVREKHRNVRIVSVVTGVSNLLGLSATAAAVILTVSASQPVALQIAVVAMAAFPGFSALINAFASREGWHDDINQYRHMSYMFERAQNIWNRDEISKHHLVFELGRELLHHNGDWLSASLSRPLEPPL